MPKRITSKPEILNICIDLFSRNGYAAVSIKDIADAIGISKASIYHWFPSKSSILVECGDFYLKEMLGILMKDRLNDSTSNFLTCSFLNSTSLKSNFLCCMMAAHESSYILSEHINVFLDFLIFSAKLPSSKVTQIIGNKIWDSFNRAIKYRKQ